MVQHAGSRLTAGGHQLIDLVELARARLDAPPSNVVLQAVAQVLGGWWAGGWWCWWVWCWWVVGVGVQARRMLWLEGAARAWPRRGTGQRGLHPPPGAVQCSPRLTGWQHTLRSSMARLRRLGMFLEEAPASSCEANGGGGGGGGQGGRAWARGAEGNAGDEEGGAARKNHHHHHHQRQQQQRQQQRRHQHSGSLTVPISCA